MTSQPAAMVSCRHPSFLSLSVVLSSQLWFSLSHLSCRSCSRAAFALALSLINWSLLRGRYCRGNLLEWCPGLIRLICTCVIEDTINNRTCWNGVLPSLFVSLSLGRLLFLSRAIFDPSLISRSLSLSLSLSRALTLARRLIYICALEDTIGIPTCWNGVLQSPSVIVSSHLRLSLSVSLSVPHSSRSACGWFCQARAAQQGQTRVTLGSLAHPSVLRPHSRLCSAAWKVAWKVAARACQRPARRGSCGSWRRRP